MKISVVVLTKNEEKNLKRCLESIKDAADEIIIIDENSSDGTIQIAEKFGAKIIENSNHEDYSAARNLGMKKAKNEWIFFIDADEELKGAMGEIEETEKTGGFKIRRIDEMWGKKIKHGESGSWHEVRLVRKDAGFWEGKVHENFAVHSGIVKDLSDCYLAHYPHQTIAEFLEEINQYSDLRAKELWEQEIKSNIWQIMLYPAGKFIQDYFLRLGFLDGTIGFVCAAMMSLHSFLVRAKMYIYELKAQS